MMLRTKIILILVLIICLIVLAVGWMYGRSRYLQGVADTQATYAQAQDAAIVEMLDKQRANAESELAALQAANERQKELLKRIAGLNHVQKIDCPNAVDDIRRQLLNGAAETYNNRPAASKWEPDLLPAPAD